MKIGIVGCGMVGATSAYALVMSGVGREIVLVDLNRARAEAEANDIYHAVPFAHPLILRAGDYPDLADARVVVIAGGVAQKPGETRLQLLQRNAEVFRKIVPSVLRHAPEAVLLVVTNPVDIMTHLAAQFAAEFDVPHTRVIGSGTTLDTARFRTLLGRHFGVDSHHVHAYVVGEHGDSEVLAWSQATIAGLNLHEITKLSNKPLTGAKRLEIDGNVRRAAYQIIAGKGATYYGVGSAVARIVDVLLHDQRAILTICARIIGVPGCDGVTLALPHLVGGQGALTTIPLPLDADEDKGFRAAVQQAKREAKTRFAAWLKKATGQVVDSDTIFDTQIKRIHEYKRQLLNALHVVILYNRLRETPKLSAPSRTFFFAGKAAPAYHFAKLVIKFINNLAATIDGDPAVQGRLKVVFVPDYCVSVAERLIPASNVSEQISTAGYEASGTSNMKFMMNGALTVGTRDGATIEMAEAAGEENFFLFGLSAEEVANSRGFYDPQWHYQNDAETRAALDLITQNHFSRHEPGVFEPILDTILRKGDHYLHLADLKSYGEAHARLGELYADKEAWTRKAVLNIAASGKFSSDRTIAEYAKSIWQAAPCPVEG